MAQATKAAFEEWEKENVAVKKACKRRSRVNWTEFRTEWGSRQSRKNADIETPMERLEFIYYLTEKKRWPLKAAEAEWEAHLANSEVADYKGYKGGVRLWINKKKHRVRETELYRDGYAVEGGERLKNPNAGDLNGLRRFAHTSKVSTSHAFFSGTDSAMDYKGSMVGLGEPEAPAALPSASDMEESVDEAACASGSQKESAKDSGHDLQAHQKKRLASLCSTGV